MTNEEVLKKNGGRRFDICLMNPPYSLNKIGDEFYKKFVYKTLELAKNVITVNPSGIFEYAANSRREKELYNSHNVSVEFIDPKLFDCGIKSNIIISAFYETGDNKITLIKNNNTKIYRNLDEIRFENSSYLEDFEQHLRQYIEEHNDTLGNHINFGPKYSGFTRRDLIIKNPPKDKIYVRIYKPNAAFNGLLYSTFHKNGKPIEYDEKALFKSSSCFVMFDQNEYKQACNFITYTKTKFLELCNKVSRYITKNKIKYLCYPWLDFNKEWTDEELFEMIGMEYNKEEIDKILNEQ